MRVQHMAPFYVNITFSFVHFFYPDIKKSAFLTAVAYFDVHFHGTPSDAKNASEAFKSSQSAALSFHNNGLFLFSDTRFCHIVNWV